MPFQERSLFFLRRGPRRARSTADRCLETTAETGMRMRMIWAMAALALSACTSPTGTTVRASDLTGRWEWQSASGGLAGRTITPATEGYTMQLQLSSDGKAQPFKNGTLTQSAQYELGIGPKAGSFGGRAVILFPPPLFATGEMAVAFPDEDHLTLADGCCDGFTYNYARS